MKKSLLALTLLAAAPFAASAAEGVSYNYVEGGYTATNLSDGLPDADGWGVKGSVAIAPTHRRRGLATASLQGGGETTGAGHLRRQAETLQVQLGEAHHGAAPFFGPACWVCG